MIRPLAVLSAVSALAFAAACAADEEPRPAGRQDVRPPAPRTATEFLDRAEAAMRQEPGWRFAVTGREDLAAPGQRTIATYKATVDLTREPAALRSRGVITTKGRKRAEWIYLLNGSALSETLVLDARAYRIVRHHKAFGFSIPYGNGNIIYAQEVQERATAPFRGTIALPRGVTA